MYETGKAASSGAGTALGEIPKTRTDPGTRWTSRPPPPASIPTTSKPGSRGGNNSDIRKGAVSLTSRPAFCIARAGKCPHLPFPHLPGSKSPADPQVLGRSCRRRRDGKPRVLLPPSACPKAASKAAQLSSTVVIDTNEERKLAPEGSANFRCVV